MKIVSITCPHCGAKLQTASNVKMLTCDYCKYDFMVDEVIKEDIYNSSRKSFSKDKENTGSKPINCHNNSSVSNIDGMMLLRTIIIIIGIGLFLVSRSLISFILIAFFIIIVICITK